MTVSAKPWTLDRARATYGIRGWSEGYFDLNDRGELVARPRRDASGPEIALVDVANAARAQGLSLPVLVRFADILRDRVDTLVNAFTSAMAADGYQGLYTAVYPIKVNQQRSVVEQILAHGDDRVGLEAGSKPELMAVLALSKPDGVVVCNGYKDREYIRLALIGRRLGHRVYIVVEKMSELDLVLEEAARLNVAPLLGVRVRLASIGAGKWQNTGGEKSKFGLSATQVLEVVERLRSAGRLEALQLLHFHLGSQIANIRDIQAGIREAARFYSEMHAMGVAIQVVDVGGGLGVDYEGSRSRSDCSMNYTVSEYAHNVVHILAEVCADHGLPCPDVISESGRALTAHHAVLVANVTDVEYAPDGAGACAPASEEPAVLHDLWAALEVLPARSPVEVYHNAVHAVGEAQAMYTLGLLSLEQRARAERLYSAVCQRVRDLLDPKVRAHREVLDELNDKLADKYFLNFSVFQSVPDVWGIDQVFPIVPLHRLAEAPERRGVIQDLTCDSDGRIDHYVGRDGVESTLPLHPWKKGEHYLLGFFMVGAYQEILGDMHNLFGDTDAVNVVLEGDGYRLESTHRGDTVDGLLRYVSFTPEVLLEAYRTKVAQAALSETERDAFMATLADGLTGYTYLEE